MSSGSRTFNALTGAEFKTILLKEVAQELTLDAQLQTQGATTKVLFLWRLTVESYPNNPPQFTVQVTQQFKRPVENPLHVSQVAGIIYKAIEASLNGDERFLMHLTYPKVTWNWNLSLEIERVGGVTKAVEIVTPMVEAVGAHGSTMFDIGAAMRQREAVAASGAQTDTPVLSELEKERAERIRLEKLLDAMSARMHETEHGQNKKAPESLALGMGDESVSIGSPMTAAESRQHDVPMHTGTGLPITAEFKASPGAGLAGSYGGGSVAGQIPTADAVTERFAIGTTHPPLSEGGAGAPDALRREAGLPIPSMQATKSGFIVDVPGNTF